MCIRGVAQLVERRVRVAEIPGSNPGTPTDMSGTLYIVATPIGNLEDITSRAIKTLKEVDVILCEDTRVTKKLLMHYEIDNHILSYHHHSSESKKEEILNLLLTGKDMALVTDAGTPGISDPGNELIDFLLNKTDIKIIPIPGASALTSALSVSGFKTNNFVFLGFMPKKGKTKLFNWLKEGKINFIYYESPYRVLKTLNEIRDHFGSEVRVVVAREMTKMFEEIVRGNISKVIEKLQNSLVKGEIVVVVEIE